MHNLLVYSREQTIDFSLSTYLLKSKKSKIKHICFFDATNIIQEDNRV